MDAPARFETADPAATHAAGVALAAAVRPGDVIALDGDLGAGKTALVKGLAEGLGVATPVTSPTFNILVVHTGPVALNHFDLYRLEHEDELEDIDFWGVLESGGVSAVEWGDRFPGALPPDHLSVSIEFAGEMGRRFTVLATGSRSRDVAAAWLAGLPGEPS